MTMLSQAIEGVLQGTNRLHQIVSSMLDVARLDNQITNPHVEPVSLELDPAPDPQGLCERPRGSQPDHESG